MTITIETMLAIYEHTLIVYCCSDNMYRFSVIDARGETFTSDNSFFTLRTAKFMGVAAIENSTSDRR